MVDRISLVKRSREQARASYNRLSRFYDILTGSSEQRFIRMGIEKLSVKPGEKVLEIGCGTGHGLLMLARLVGKQGKAFGIDISEGMLRKARARIEKTQPSHRVELTRGDARNLPYPNDSFDAVFMSFTLELFSASDIPVVLGEARQVLRKGGRMVVFGISNKSKNNVMMQAYRAAHRHFPSYVDCRPIDIREHLEKMNFSILYSDLRSMWGLGVEIVLARKP